MKVWPPQFGLSFTAWRWSPALGWGVQGWWSHHKVTKPSDSSLTARGPRRAASAARSCPNKAFPHKQSSCSTISGFPSLTFTPEMFPAHPICSLFTVGPFASSSASSSAWGPGKMIAPNGTGGWQRAGRMRGQRSGKGNFTCQIDTWTCLPPT